MFDTRLKTLVTLLQTQNYTRTAEALFITQPAVTHHIKTLEKENNIVLFSNPKTFKLSPSGNVIYQYALRVMQQYQQLRLSLKASSNRIDKLSFCVTNQVSFSFMPTIIKKWINSQNNELINMQVDNPTNIFRKIDDGLIDFAIIDNSFDKMKYDSILLHKSSIVLACSKDHALAHKQKIRMEQLKDECLILDINESGIRKLIESQFNISNIYLSSFSNAIEINDPNIIKNLVVNNSGLGFFYLSSIQHELKEEQLKIIELVDIELKQEFNLISNIHSFNKNKFNKLAEEMISFLREELYK